MALRSLYTLLLYLLVPFLLGRLLLRSRANPGYATRWAERFGRAPRSIRPGGIWIHAVSVGEVIAAIPLVERLLVRYPGLQVTITTMTPTGSERVRDHFGERVGHAFMPFDLPGAVGCFLDRVAPRAVVVMETELWPNLFHACGSRSIPLVLANARMSPGSARGYRRIAGLVGPALRRLSVVAAQTEADAERLIDLGAPADRVKVTGSVKFDFSVPDRLPQDAAALRGRFGNRPVWVAGSTHAGEEEIVLDAAARVRAAIPDALLIVVPRHPERFAGVASLVLRRGLDLARRSTGDDPGSASVYLCDTMGELLLMYAAADVAFVGGSLVPTGGHNLIEPAALGLPVLTGPHLHNFSRIAEQLKEAGAMRRVDDGAQLAASVMDYLVDRPARVDAGRAGQEVVMRNRGALDRLESMVVGVLDG